MAEIAISAFHSPFQGHHSESAKRPLTAVLVIGHVMPVGCVIELAIECVSVHAQEHNRAVRAVCVSVCMHKRGYVC